jgi:hypothetical protein
VERIVHSCGIFGPTMPAEIHLLAGTGFLTLPIM